MPVRAAPQARHDRIHAPSRVVSFKISPHVYQFINIMCRFVVSISYPHL